MWRKRGLKWAPTRRAGVIGGLFLLELATFAPSIPQTASLNAWKASAFTSSLLCWALPLRAVNLSPLYSVGQTSCWLLIEINFQEKLLGCRTNQSGRGARITRKNNEVPCEGAEGAGDHRCLQVFELEGLILLNVCDV